MALVELLKEAGGKKVPNINIISTDWRTIWCLFSGCPDGVVNVIHGQHDTVNFICDHPDIRAVSFVGGDAAGKHIYERGSSKGGFWERREILRDMQGRGFSATWGRRTTE